MSSIHDVLATQVGDAILEKIRKEEDEWKQIFSTTIHRTGDWDWPRPDYVCQDTSLNVSYAMEFKPPNQTKREYLTGLGQALAYLQRHNYAALIVPEKADDNFPIGLFLKEMFESNEFKDIPISLIQYDEANVETDTGNSIKILKTVNDMRKTSPLFTANNTSTFWSWWRDISHYEVFQLLCLSDIHRGSSQDIYTDNVWPDFFDALITGNTQQWDGSPRNKSKGDKNKLYTSEKQNYKIPLSQLGLWNPANGELTAKGYKLLTLGKLYGPDSIEYLDYLTYIVLIDGKHLELIYEVRKFQKENKGKMPSSRDDFLTMLDEYLDNKGAIGPRKPGRKTTDAKQSYVRDEPKLWNKLKLIDNGGGTRYFIPEVGLEFNLERITEVLRKEYKII